MISSEEAWVKTKSGGVKLNPMYRFVGNVDIQFPNMILSASDKKNLHILMMYVNCLLLQSDN